MKAGFDTIDVVAIVAELKKLPSSDKKSVLLIESGVRMHITDFSWPKGMMPLGFTMKLRKHIKNKRLSNIAQLGIDRVVDITFGFDEFAYHLIVELYGKGNMFLTDAAYTILHLLRQRTDVNQDVRYATRERFPVELARPVPEALLNLEDEASLEKLVQTIDNILEDAIGPWNSGPPNDDTELIPVNAALNNALLCGTGLLEHCCCLAGLSNLKRKNTGSKCCIESDAQPLESDACREAYARKISVALRDILLQIDGKVKTEENSQAIILGTLDSKEPGKLSKYDSYYPTRFAHLSSKPGVDFSSFNKAVDEFYSSLESQRTEGQNIQKERKAAKKLDNIKRDQEQRIQDLKNEQVEDVLKAQMLEFNAELVDQVLVSINHAIANQANWKVLEQVLQEQKELGDNPVANCIVRLQLESNQAVLRLSNPYADDSSDKEPTEVDILIDLDYTALQNAKRYYARRRQAEAKEQKTIAGTQIALKMASKKAAKTQTRTRVVQQISKTRKPFWFEKFHWFVSSENYLVLAGRDAAQNENLIKRYFRQHDIYVHADVHGASSVIVKARHLQPNERLPLWTEEDSLGAPPQPPMKTLIEAGQMAVALSNAWSAKVITNAWWVHYDQVSKTAPTGEYLTTGSFVIRGRKNMLPQCHLTYGLGIIFKLAEDSVERHLGERCIDREAACAAEASVVKYEVPASGGMNDDDDEDELSNAFKDASLDLNINRTNRPLVQQSKKTQQVKKQPQRPASPQQRQSASTKETGPNPLKRGQKAKMKKIRQKYGDQDEEERQMRLFLLQGAKAKPSAVHDIGKTPSHSEKDEVDNSEPTTEIESSTKAEHDDAGGTINDERHENEDLQKTEQIPDNNRTRVKDDDGSPEVEGDDVEGTGTDKQLLEMLTGRPMDEDSLLVALPFCAPYTALGKFKYKAKLTPGTQKRGKITKMVIHHFTTDKTATQLEKQLIQSIQEEIICRVLPGSAKITFPDPIRR